MFSVKFIQAKIAFQEAEWIHKRREDAFNFDFLSAFLFGPFAKSNTRSLVENRLINYADEIRKLIFFRSDEQQIKLFEDKQLSLSTNRMLNNQCGASRKKRFSRLIAVVF